MNKTLRAFAVAILCLFPLNYAAAQGAALTVLSIKSMLDDALKAFNSTLNTAGAEVRSSGASLAANAQNVITDMNTQLGGRLNDTIDKLTGAQKQLAEDALLLTRQMQTATTTIIAKGGAEARQTIAEADITAYNASYSLPCRTLTPRIVFSTPEHLRRGSAGPMEVRLKGNFLDIGAAPAVMVDGKPAKLISRSRNEMVVSIPAVVLASITETRSVAVAFTPEEARRTNLWLYCYDRNVPMGSPLSQAVTLRPELTYALSGAITGTYDTYESWSHAFRYNRSDGNCEASFNDTQQFCAPEGYELVGAPSVERHSANCNSSIGAPQIAGRRCANVPAHLGGCGYDRVLGQIVNCKGRGFFDYTLHLSARRAVPANIDDYPFKLGSTDGKQRSFQAAHPAATKNLPNARWRYQVEVAVKEGSKVVRTISAGDGNPNPEGVSSKLAGGVVYINVTD